MIAMLAAFFTPAMADYADFVWMEAVPQPDAPFTQKGVCIENLTGSMERNSFQMKFWFRAPTEACTGANSQYISLYNPNTNQIQVGTLPDGRFAVGMKLSESIGDGWMVSKMPLTAQPVATIDPMIAQNVADTASNTRSLNTEVELLKQQTKNTYDIVNALGAKAIADNQNSANANAIRSQSYDTGKKKLGTTNTITTVSALGKGYYEFSKKDPAVKERGKNRIDTAAGLLLAITGGGYDRITAENSLNGLGADCVQSGGCPQVLQDFQQQ